MSFCRPAARPPLRPSLPPSLPPSRTKHRADGLTRRSNLSLLPFPYPSRFSTAPFLGLVLLILSRPFTPLRHSSPLTPPESPFYTLCHFAPPLVQACRSLPPPPSPFCLPFPLAFSLSLVFLVVHVFVRFLISLSFFLPSSLRQATPKIPTGRSTSDSSLERAFEKKRIFARSARDEKTPK